MIIGSNRKLKRQLEQKMEKAIGESEKWLETQKRTLELVKAGGGARVRVHMRSHWEDEGGKSIDYETDGSIADALRGALEMFQSANGYVGSEGDINGVNVSLVVGEQTLRVDEGIYRAQLKAAIAQKEDGRKRKRREN